MNEVTLNKLKANPHYKMSKKQQEEWEKLQRRPMVSFGTPNYNHSEVEKHPVNVVKISHAKDEKDGE